MSQRFKTIYFPDHPAEESNKKNVTLAFREKDAALFDKLQSLSSEDIRNLIKIYSFKELKERRDIFVKGLQELGLRVAIPKATPYLWIQVPEGFDDEDFVLNTLINKAHVASMPGSYFGNNGRGYMRATLFLSRSEIEEALERIHKVKTW